LTSCPEPSGSFTRGVRTCSQVLVLEEVLVLLIAPLARAAVAGLTAKS
jgi:hypothetical protein